VVVFPAGGGRPIAVTNSESQNRCPAWSPDGKFLWILSDRDGQAGQVYAIPIGRDGKVAGATIRAGIEAEWIGLSGNRIAYSQPERRENIWSVPIPTGAQTDLSSAEQVTRDNAVIETVSVSADGKWLVYDSDKPGNADIYRKSISGGDPEPLTRDKRPEFMASLSPDGTELAWHRWIGKKRHIVVRKVDGESEVDLVPDTLDRGGARWSPDGGAIAGWIHDGVEGTIFVVKRDASGKWGKASWQLFNGQLPYWTPDGRTIVFLGYDGSIQTIPADSGARRTVYAPRKDTDDPIVLNLAWSKSPDTVYFIAHDRSGNGSIWSLSLSTGAKKLLVRLDDPARSVGLTIATDQRRFYFTLDERLSKIWWAELKKK
jgi:Tol biopolymer transport system component